MDLEVGQKNNVEINVSQSNQTIRVSNPSPVSITVERADVELTPRKSSGMSFDFITRIIAGGAVRRMTKVAFEALPIKDEALWYFVTNTSGTLKEIYAGSTLFAKADSGGNIGFPYTFPMTF